MLSKAKDRPKSKEERLKEKEKLDAETQRSIAVAEMKKAHKLIEDTEKMRKRPILQSVCLRIDDHIKTLAGSGKVFGEPPFADNKILADNAKQIIKSNYEIYESIRFDFQKSMEIRDEEMDRLFPKIEMETTDGWSVSNLFYRISQQLRHMRIYCMRLL